MSKNGLLLCLLLFSVQPSSDWSRNHSHTHIRWFCMYIYTLFIYIYIWLWHRAAVCTQTLWLCSFVRSDLCTDIYEASKQQRQLSGFLLFSGSDARFHECVRMLTGWLYTTTIHIYIYVCTTVVSFSLSLSALGIFSAQSSAHDWFFGPAEVHIQFWFPADLPAVGRADRRAVEDLRQSSGILARLLLLILMLLPLSRYRCWWWHELGKWKVLILALPPNPCFTRSMLAWYRLHYRSQYWRSILFFLLAFPAELLASKKRQPAKI